MGPRPIASLKISHRPANRRLPFGKSVCASTITPHEEEIMRVAHALLRFKDGGPVRKLEHRHRRGSVNL